MTHQKTSKKWHKENRDKYLIYLEKKRIREKERRIKIKNWWGAVNLAVDRIDEIKKRRAINHEKRYFDALYVCRLVLIMRLSRVTPK